MDHPSSAHARVYVVRRIKHAINLDLSSKGMKLSSDDPDILVAIHPKVSHNLNISNWGYSYTPYTVYWGDTDTGGDPASINISIEVGH